MSTDEQVHTLARLIKRSAQGRGWCSTPPDVIARYLLANGVVLPVAEPKEVNR